MTTIYLTEQQKAAMGGMTPMDRVELVMIHCTASRPSLDGSYDDLWNWHVVNKGWSAIGYHWAYTRDGFELETRPEAYRGAGCTAVNDRAIHLSYFGGVTEHDVNIPEDNLLDNQERLIVDRLVKIGEAHPHLTAQDIVGHNEFDPKACPSFNVADKIPKWIEMAGIAPGEPTDPEPELPSVPVGQLVQIVQEQGRRIDALEAINRDLLISLDKYARMG